jgi:uncharacterized protein YgbK (DUF1537 family)
MSASVLIIADDFTGANAAAAGFARAGMRAVTIGSHQKASTLAEFAPRFDVLVVSTDGRHAPPAETGRRIVELVEAGWPVELVCNRVDTTLRGHLGASTKVMLETVGRLSGRRAVALCAPAHPAAGRQTVDGIQLLHGRRLELTELARDVRGPVRTSDVAELVAASAGLRAGQIPLRSVTGDPAELVTLIQDLLPRADVLIADAISEEHLTRVAEAAVRAGTVRAGTDVAWVAVDPGPGSLALATALRLDRPAARPPVLVVSGSATELVRTQLRRLLDDHEAAVVRAAVDPATGRLDPGRLTAATLRAFDRDPAPGLVVVATAIDAADVGPADAVRLPGDLAAAMREVLRERDVGGLLCGGGDVAAAMLSALDATGLEVEREIVPLAVAGVVVGGRWDALPVVTKGGLVGDSGTLAACVAHLRRRAEVRRTSVPVGAETSVAAPVPRKP